MWRLKEDKSYFDKNCFTEFSQPQLPISGDKNMSFLLV